MEINLVPTLLGSGERLFDGAGDDLHGLELVRTVATPKVTHLKFAKRWALVSARSYCAEISFARKRLSSTASERGAIFFTPPMFALICRF